MSSLPDTFCIFILTHGRPDNLVTLKTLKKCGYTGKLFLVVDNEDISLARYIELYGKESVIVFDKKAEADICDEGNNFDERRTILMARNACFGIAERLGITHFMELDDDYSDFRYKLLETGNHLSIIKNLDRVLFYVLRFYENSGCTSLAFAQNGDFIGGFDNGNGLYRFSKRKCMNTFICSTSRQFRFVGAMNEDVNTYTTLGAVGNVFLTIPFAAINQAATQSQANGITDMYQRFGTYCKSFTTVMMMPSAVKVSMMQSKHTRIHHAINWKCCVPCIVREDIRSWLTEL